MAIANRTRTRGRVMRIPLAPPMPPVVALVVPRPLNILERNQLFPWQEELTQMIEADLELKTTYWIWDNAGGQGKSQLTRFLEHNDIGRAIRGTTDDVVGLTRLLSRADLTTTKAVVWDCFYSQDRVPWGLIEALYDGIISGRREPTVLVHPTPTVVLSNNRPADLPTDPSHQVRLLVIENGRLRE